MLFRRLDRYVTSFFVWHFVLCLVAILGLYIVVDTFSKLDEFARHSDPVEQLRWIAVYHLYQTPVLVNQFLPIITLLAGIISLARLASYNELNAIKAAGVSMHRTLAPIFLCAIAIVALAAANQELLLPYLEPDIRSVRVEALKSDVVKTELFVYDDESHATVLADTLNTAVGGKELRRIEAVANPLFGPDGTEIATGSLQAASAVWAGQWLLLRNGHTVDAAGQKRPFRVRMLRTTIAAQDYRRPVRLAARLADGTPAHVIGASPALPALKFTLPASADTPGNPTGATPRRFEDSLQGRAVALRFAAIDHEFECAMMLNGYLTEPYAGEQTKPPVAIQAAFWLNGQWLGRAQTYTQATDESSRTVRRLIVFDGQPLPLKTPPKRLVETKEDPSLKSSAELQQRARKNPRNRRLQQRIAVILHARLSFPLANVVLLLVAIPLLFQQEGGKSTWIGIGLALLLSVVFYFVNYACQFVGQNPRGLFAGVPALAAWLPIGLFGLTGVILLARINT